MLFRKPEFKIRVGVKSKEGSGLKVTYGLQLYLKETSIYAFLVNIAKFFDSEPPVASVNLLFSIKSIVGWFLLKRVDLVIVCVRMINLQKPKTCPK